MIVEHIVYNFNAENNLPILLPLFDVNLLYLRLEFICSYFLNINPSWADLCAEIMVYENPQARFSQKHNNGINANFVLPYICSFLFYFAPDKDSKCEIK